MIVWSTFGRRLVALPGISSLFTVLGVSAYIQTLLNDADAATARATLGLGTLETNATGLSYGGVTPAKTFHAWAASGTIGYRWQSGSNVFDVDFDGTSAYFSNYVSGGAINFNAASATGTNAFYVNSVLIGNFDAAGAKLAYPMGRGAPVTKTADFTLAATESSIINNKAGSTCTATLSGGFAGRELFVNNEQAQALVSAASNVVPKVGGAAGTAVLPATDGAWAFLIHDGTNWKIMMSGI
jgi:hypothetical protein